MTTISRKTVGVLVLLIFILASCNPGTYKPILKSRYDAIGDTLTTVKVINSKSPASDVYRIQVADMLSVRNVKISEIEDGAQAGGGQGGGSGASAGGYRVDDDGTVTLPTIGKVQVLDLTSKEATDKIQGLYNVSYFKNAVIVVSVMNQRITILGGFTNQGVFYLQNEKTTLAQGIGMAGGISPQADPRTLKIIRQSDKSDPEIIYVNIRNMASLANSKLILQNRDIITVEPDKRLARYEKSQSGISIFQTILVVVSTGLLVFTSFFK